MLILEYWKIVKHYKENLITHMITNHILEYFPPTKGFFYHI